MDMDIVDNLRISRLFDIYGQLLTSKQQNVMSAYFYDNLTLTEIGDNLSISRQAVKDSISACIRILENYESHLHIIENQSRTIQALQALKECPTSSLDSAIDRIINEIRS